MANEAHTMVNSAGAYKTPIECRRALRGCFQHRLPSLPCAISKPRPSPRIKLASGTRTFSKSTSQWPPKAGEQRIHSLVFVQTQKRQLARRIVATQHAQRSHNRHALSVHRHNQHTLLLMQRPLSPTLHFALKIAMLFGRCFLCVTINMQSLQCGCAAFDMNLQAVACCSRLFALISWQIRNTISVRLSIRWAFYIKKKYKFMLHLSFLF